MEIHITEEMKERAGKYIVFTGDDDVDTASIVSLEMLRRNISKGIKNDTAKYSLPECFKTDLYWTINARSLRNFLKLRTSPRALLEMRTLCKQVWGELPDQVKFMFQDVYTLGDKIQ